MKKLLPFLCAMIIFIGLALSGCGSSVLSTPDANANIIGNGGLVATKGDYVYFVNGFENYSTLNDSNKNKKGKVNVSKICRGIWKDGELTEVETLISKVGGYEYGSLNIFGDKLYFATPNTKKDATGAIKFEYITFASINLDGTNYNEYFTANAYTSTNKYTYINKNNKLFLIVLNGTDLVKIDICNDYAKTTLATDVTSAVMAQDVSCNSDFKTSLDTDNFVYYTCAREHTAGNLLKNVNIFDGTTTDLTFTSASESITLKSYKDGFVYYTKADTFYYSRDYSTNNGSTEIAYPKVAYTSFTPLGKNEHGNEQGVLVEYNSKAYIQPHTTDINSNALISADINYGAYSNGYLYYVEANTLKRINVLDNKIEVLSGELGEVKFDGICDVDFDGNRVYVLAKVENSTNFYTYVSYLRALANEGEYECELMGEMTSSDVTAIKDAE